MTHHWLSFVRARCDAAASSLLNHGEPPAVPVPAAPPWATSLGLDVAEQLTAWTLVAHQLDRGISTMLDALCSGPDVTLGGLAAVVYGAEQARAVLELAESSRLFATGLVQLDDVASSAPWSRRCVRASDRLLAIAMTDGAAPPVPRPWTIERPDGGHDLCVSDATLAALRTAARATDGVVVVHGLPSTGRRTLVERVLAEQGCTVRAVDLRRMPAAPGPFAHAVRELATDCLLGSRALVLCNADAITADAERSALLRDVLSSLPLPRIFMTSSVRFDPRWERPAVTIAMEPPAHAARAKLWASALELGLETDAQKLATRYPLAPGLLLRACAATRAAAAGDVLEARHVYAGIRTVLDGTLGTHAKRLTVTQTWDDVVLSDDHVEALKELLARVRGRHEVYEDWGFATKVGRGLGVSALFSGPPGTGKTMVAGLIAQELGLEVYQVDSSKIVSKYIGETEKNLAAVFDAAEAGHAILLFDEADSLFGKRTDVKSSHDRSANLETNYLLQRLESFSGVCILTSNHETNIDPAFQRRLSLHLRFELPDVDERAKLWRAMLPPAAPVHAEIGFAALASKFAMSGGYIRNAVLRAAFGASDRKEPITHAALERAARREYEGMGKIAA